jgi:hypothetical protein
MYMRAKRFLDFLEFLLISIYSFLFFSHIWSFSYFLIFQDRDLERAKQLAGGSLVFFGPEMLGGGNLPGGFYYYLLSIPYLLGLNWSACWYLMIILLSTGIGLAWIFIASMFGYFSAIIFISLIFNSAALLIVEGFFLNPSFLPFFTICSIIGLSLTFSKVPVSKNRYWMATCFLVGLSMQIHFNAFFILLSGIFLQLTAQRIKINQLNRRYFFMGLIIFVLTILPYYISNFLSKYGIIIGQQAPSISGSNMNATTLLLRRIWSGLLNINLESFLQNMMFQLQPEVLLCLFVLPAGFWVFNHILQKDKTESKQEDNRVELFKILAIIGVFNVIPQLLLFITTGLSSVYYTVNVILVIAFIASAIPVRALNESQRVKYYYLTAACLLLVAIYKFWKAPEFNLNAMFEISIIYYFVIFTIFAGIMIVKKVGYATILLVVFMLLLPNISLKYNLSLWEGKAELFKTIVKLEDIRNLSRYIIRETHWDFATARKKIMRMNILSELGLRQIYLDESKGTTCGMGSKNPDGYIITILDSTDDKTRLEKAPNEWLFSKRPLHVIHEFMINDNLRVDKPVFFGNVVLLEYYLKDPKTGASLSIQNIGYAYEMNEFDGYFEEYPLGVSTIGNGLYFIHWNNCLEDERKCSIGYLVDLEKLSSSDKTVKVSIIGQSLTSPSICVIPDWSEMLISPYITFECDGKKYKKELIRRLGNIIINNIYYSNLVAAPYEANVVNPCKGRVSQITVGWDSLEAYSFSRGVRMLPDNPMIINDK